MSATANQIGVGMSRYWSIYLDLTGQQVGWNNRTWQGNLSGYGDPTQQFSGPVTLTVRIARPRTTDEIVDPERQAGYMTDEYFTMLYPSSAIIRYRDVMTLSTTEGPANFIVTTPTMAPWGNSPVVKKTTIRRLVNLSGPGPIDSGWPA
jgi:hypothetical protein